MARLQDVLIIGPRIDQPLATEVSPGTVYSVSDEGNIQEQSDGTNWVPFGGGGGGGGGGITALTGEVTAGPGSGSQAATITPNAVGNTKLRDSVALSVIGRSAATPGDPADIVGATVGDVLQVLAGPVVGFGPNTGGGGGGSGITQLTGDVAAGPGAGSQGAVIQPDVVSNAKLTNMAAATIKGRASGVGVGDPQDLSPDQATAIINPVVGDTGAGGTKGLVPAPAAGDAAANKFLGADGTFKPAPGGITQLTGDVLAGPGSGVQVATIAPGIIQDPMLANMPQKTIKGRQDGAGTGAPQNLTPTQATAILDTFVGDVGAGGIKGLVPPPAAGDAAAGKFLKADGTFAVPAGGGSSGPPIGTMILWPGAALPAGHLWCDGVLYDKTVYSVLYAALGGAASPWGQNSTHFAVPDMRDRMPIGASTFALGSSGGAINHTHAQVAHTHAAGALAVASHTHAVGSLTVDSHAHGAAGLVVASHAHDGSGLAVASHTHGAVGLGVDNHFHSLSPGGTTTNGDHTHSLSGVVTDNAGSHVHRVNNTGTGDPGGGQGIVSTTDTQAAGVHQHNISGNVGNAGDHSHGLAGTTDFASPGVVGSTAAAAPGVTGSTGAAAPGVTGATAGAGASISGASGAAAPGVTGSTANDGATTTGPANQAFTAVRYAIKYQ